MLHSRKDGCSSLRPSILSQPAGDSNANNGLVWRLGCLSAVSCRSMAAKKALHHGFVLPAYGSVVPPSQRHCYARCSFHWQSTDEAGMLFSARYITGSAVACRGEPTGERPTEENSVSLYGHQHEYEWFRTGEQHPRAELPLEPATPVLSLYFPMFLSCTFSSVSIETIAVQTYTGYRWGNKTRHDLPLSPAHSICKTPPEGSQMLPGRQYQTIGGRT